jgi:capsular exopolysaccharide synthesis family protein
VVPELAMTMRRTTKVRREPAPSFRYDAALVDATTLPPASQEQPLDLRQYLSVLRIRKWTVIATTAVVLFAVMAYSLRQTPMYTSTAKVLVKPITANQQLQLNGAVPAATQLSLDTERELVSSAAVAQIAAEQLGGRISADELVRHLSVSVPANTEILDISYSSPDPLRAQTTAQAFAAAYLRFKTEEAQQTSAAVSKRILEQITSLQQQLDRARFTFSQSDEGSNAQDRAANTIQIVSQQIATLRNQLATVGSLDIDPGAIIQAADLPTSPSSPNHILNGALGLFLGLALGVGLAFVRERLDDTLRDRVDLEEHIGAPALVVIPKVAGRKAKRPRVVSIEEPHSAATEAYKTLRTSVLFSAAQNGLKSLMVSSATSGEGKTTTAVNLATTLAQAGKRVILVSADLRKPKAGQYFVTVDEKARGLSSVLTGEMSLQEALQPSGIDRLWVLASGPIPANPAEMAQSGAMATLLAALRDSADFTIVDSAPALVVTDALAMAPHVDGILYVADAAETTRGTVARSRIQLEHVGGRVIGAVLNNFDVSKAAGYGYEYSYRYVYRYAYAEPELVTTPPEEAGRRRRRSGS